MPKSKLFVMIDTVYLATKTKESMSLRVRNNKEIEKNEHVTQS